MSNVDQSPSSDSPINAAAAAPYVQLFQKAHQKIVLLERIEEQFGQLIIKRQELQEELKELQEQINEEFDTRLRSAATGHADHSATARALSVTISDSVKRNSGIGAASGNGNGNGSSNRFAATTIEADER